MNGAPVPQPKNSSNGRRLLIHGQQKESVRTHPKPSKFWTTLRICDRPVVSGVEASWTLGGDDAKSTSVLRPSEK